jgi:hypothetical protein
MNLASKRTSLRLFEASDEQALVQMHDGDAFMIAVTDAARACQVFDKARDFAKQFRELVDTTLAQWIDRNRAHIQSAHLTIRERDILFVVVQKRPEFDANLSDSLTDLDLAVANSHDLGLIDLEVLLIPSVSEESCTAFLSSGHRLKYAK